MKHSLNYQGKFPAHIPIPPPLVQLCGWLETNGYPISGDFELRPDDGNSIKYWFGKDTVGDRFAVFGAGGDGSLYVIWQQDDGRTPVAHMGSEGIHNFVLAADFVDFLRLLAVGYDEIGFSDLGCRPSGDGINPAFQEWVRTTFSVAIPGTGAEITGPAQ